MNDACSGCRDAEGFTYMEQQFVVNPGHIGYPSTVWVNRCRKESTCEKFKKAREFKMEEEKKETDSINYVDYFGNKWNKSDNVNHPSHYADGCSLECIDIMETVFGPEVVFDYAIVNAFKYLWRYKNKNGQEDIKKAKWYLDKAHELDKKEDFIGSRRNRYWKVQDLYAKVIYKERGKEDGEVQ